jgi:hypothetical protein
VMVRWCDGGLQGQTGDEGYDEFGRSQRFRRHDSYGYPFEIQHNKIVFDGWT